MIYRMILIFFASMCLYSSIIQSHAMVIFSATMSIVFAILCLADALIDKQIGVKIIYDRKKVVDPDKKCTIMFAEDYPCKYCSSCGELVINHTTIGSQ